MNPQLIWLNVRKFQTRTAVALLFLLMATVFVLPVQGQKKLTAGEAKDHVSETATVCGNVVGTRYAATTKGQPTFLNIDQPYPNQIFTAVIWGENRSKFGKAEDDYKGKRICISGKITAYVGQPEIVVTDPKQIMVESKK